MTSAFKEQGLATVRLLDEGRDGTLSFQHRGSMICTTSTKKELH